MLELAHAGANCTFSGKDKGRADLFEEQVPFSALVIDFKDQGFVYTIPA